jgi:hypothetical protein
MDNVIAYPGLTRSSGRRRGGKVDPLIAEIIDALVHFRGQAHRDLVCDFIASRRAGQPVKASAGLRAEVISAFNSHIDAIASARRPRPLIGLPFGPGSHRWGLSPEGAPFFEGQLSMTRRA